jgi:hypothetical protein
MDILAVAFVVPLEFRKHEVMRFESKQRQVFPYAREKRTQPTLISLRRSYNPHRIQIHAVVLVKSRSLASDAVDRVEHGLGEQADEVNIIGGPGYAVCIHDREPAETLQSDRLDEVLVQLAKEGPPWFRGPFISRHTAIVPR